MVKQHIAKPDCPQGLPIRHRDVGGKGRRDVGLLARNAHRSEHGVEQTPRAPAQQGIAIVGGRHGDQHHQFCPRRPGRQQPCKAGGCQWSLGQPPRSKRLQRLRPSGTIADHRCLRRIAFGHEFAQRLFRRRRWRPIGLGHFLRQPILGIIDEGPVHARITPPVQRSRKGFAPVCVAGVGNVGQAVFPSCRICGLDLPGGLFQGRMRNQVRN